MSSLSYKIPVPTVEVSHISSYGVWLFYDEREFFLPFSDFPWFKDAPVSEAFNIQQTSPGHFYWPDLDINLSIDDAISYPETFS